jgi:hypothetical protein
MSRQSRVSNLVTGEKSRLEKLTSEKVDLEVKRKDLKLELIKAEN